MDVCVVGDFATGESGVELFPPMKLWSDDLWSSRGVRLMLRGAKVFGVYTFNRRGQRYPSTHISARLWQTFLLILTGIVAVIDTWKSVTRFRTRLSSLEFTAIAMAVYRGFYVIRCIISVVQLFFLSTALGRVFYDVDRVCMDSSSRSMVIRRKVGRLALVLCFAGSAAHAAVLLANYFCFVGIVAELDRNDPGCGGWWCPTSYPLMGTVPTWVTFVSYVVGFFVEIGVQIVPQCIILLLIYALGLRFKDFTESIKELTQYEHKRAGERDSLRHLTQLHLELSRIVFRFDRAFSFIFLHSYANDFMGFIATASLLLHHRAGVVYGNIDNHLLPLFMALMTVQCVTALLRTGFGVWLSEQAHAVLPHLYELNLRAVSPEERFLCTSFIARLQGPRIALTAGGFFYITREFVITIFGVLLTYVLFVYQMQDQKQDMSSLPKLSDIVRAFRVEFANVATNSTF